MFCAPRIRRIGGVIAAVVMAYGLGLSAAPQREGARKAPGARPRPSAAPAVPQASAAASSQTTLVHDYCATCHNDRAKAGGLSLAAFDAARAADAPETAEKMIHKLRAGMMPPAGARRPAGSALTDLVEFLESTMDAAEGSEPRPGWRPFQRLNRPEYARAVHDLLDVQIDAAAFLPPDTMSNSFDNLAEAQSFSPALQEGYLRAASRVAALAIGDPVASAAETGYKLAKTASQLRRAPGAPPGTRGGLSMIHTFPADGDYTFRMDLFAEPLGLLYGSTAKDQQLEVSIDGARVALFSIDPKMSEEKTGLSLKTPPLHVQAGPRRVTAAFLRTFEGPINDLISPIEHTLADTEIGTAYGITTLPHLRSLSIVGPTVVTGLSDTPSRRRIFTCRPTTAAEEPVCAREIAVALATRAFRGPVSERHVTRLMRFYDEGRRAGNFESGIGRVVEALLASPQFLFRLEPAPATARPGQPYRLSDVELASRLSFFLWDAPPDDELRMLATMKQLRTPASIARQTSRMLAAPQSEALATRFASQWLRLQDVAKVSPDPIQFPTYDDTLADGFRRETELFFDSIVREDRSVLDLLTADYTFVNERVARHYGIPHVTGSAFRRVALPSERSGLLTHGSVLVLTSNPDRTSPVQRGKWILEVLLGSPPPPPPPDVPPLEVTSATANGKVLSVRQRMEDHRSNPACASCHRVIDPLGLALEHFDASGRWRTKDGEFPVDATGMLYDGTAMRGVSGLRDALLKHRDAYLLSFTESLLTYAIGRRVEAADMPTVRRIIREAARHDYRMSAFIRGVVDSPAFQMSTAAAPPTTDGIGHR